MRRSLLAIIALLILLTSLSGCGVVIRQYVYPPAVDLGQGLRGYLYESVNAEGYTAETTDDSVDFQYDPTTQVRYLLDPGFSIAIVADGSKLTDEQLEAHFASVRARAEEILAIARARQVPVGPASVKSAEPDPAAPETAQPSSVLAADPPAPTGTCSQLSDCYTTLAASFCTDPATPCPFEITEEISEGDESACLKMLKSVPFILVAHTAKNPDAQVPPACIARTP